MQVSNNCLRSYAAVGCVQVELGRLVNFSQLTHFEQRQLEKTMAKLASIGVEPCRRRRIETASTTNIHDSMGQLQSS